MIPPIDACTTVAEISDRIERRFVDEPEFQRVRVRGKVRKKKQQSDESKLQYFRLICENNGETALEAVWFPRERKRNFIKLIDGISVVVEGRLTTFGRNSSYQIEVDKVIPIGSEDLGRDREERWRRLEREGLFSKENKQAIPYLPEYIGVVCSPTSAAYSDIKGWLRDYYPTRYELILKPVRVQGDEAAQEISAAIESIARESPRPEVVIVARGGGADEDLSVFDDENVVRAAARCAVPLISGVGHNPDEHLIDFASDLCVPTPTAAAAVLQIEDRKRAVGKNSAEPALEEETEEEEESWAELAPQMLARLEEVGERLEETEKIVHESKERLDGLDGETGKSRGSRAFRGIAILGFLVSALAIMILVNWPISGTLPQWPEVCQRYLGTSPLCK